jgi:argininosuccinate lyase
MSLSDMTAGDLQSFSPAFTTEALSLLSLRSSVERKRSAGSTAPKEVARALARWDGKLRGDR